MRHKKRGRKNLTQSQPTARHLGHYFKLERRCECHDSVVIKKRMGGGGELPCAHGYVYVYTCDDGERGVESERWMFLLRLLLLHITELGAPCLPIIAR